MKKFDQIHETVLKDAIDIFTGIRDIVSDDDGLEKLIAKHTGKKSTYIRSIANKSNDLICVFPVMSSRNIAIGNQAMVSKAIEKNLVAMLQMLFSAIQVSDADNAFEYIKTFHTNINKSAKSFDIDDVITVSNLIDGMTESAFKVGAKVDMGIVEAVKQDLKRMNFVLESNISTRPISESFTCNIDPSGKYVVEVKPYREDNSSSVNVFNMGSSSPVEPAVVKDRERIKFNYDLDKIDSQINKDKVDFFKNQVLPTEYKKANELQPTLMVINFKIKSGDRYIPVDSMVIGVKAKLYPIGSEDIITHLVAKTKDANWIQKFIKASTKEISFFKDFLFAIDKAKVDALSMSRKGSSNMMWKVLERRANKSKFNKLMARSNDSTAITTIMVSQNEVDYMKKEYQVDISDIHTARTLLDQYNLIGLCIVDESLEIAKFLYDTGDDMWETISFSNLERESNDNTYKKVVNLMTKVM
uniref:Uncharacterized protein n=1 Tax=Myoviridae sp. ctwwN25 TaxID=2825209 RepID=A0A8S5PP50_9CAUD|nr:MAG TPA: hypothetical protein [Myoviridae sp. ctwwN25]DAR38437.1 MAG TPA: hypothetical protein [Caudoviricetes sp.]